VRQPPHSVSAPPHHTPFLVRVSIGDTIRKPRAAIFSRAMPAHIDPMGKGVARINAFNLAHQRMRAPQWAWAVVHQPVRAVEGAVSGCEMARSAEQTAEPAPQETPWGRHCHCNRRRQPSHCCVAATAAEPACVWHPPRSTHLRASSPCSARPAQGDFDVMQGRRSNAPPPLATPVQQHERAKNACVGGLDGQMNRWITGSL
jgi:hypothetical protein